MVPLFFSFVFSAVLRAFMARSAAFRDGNGAVGLAMLILTRNSPVLNLKIMENIEKKG